VAPSASSIAPQKNHQQALILVSLHETTTHKLMVNAPFTNMAAEGGGVDTMASALKRNQRECEQLREELDDSRLLNSSLLKEAHSLKDSEPSGKELMLQKELDALNVAYKSKCTELSAVQQKCDKEIACMQSELSVTKQTLAMLRIGQNSFNKSLKDKKPAAESKQGCCTIS